MTRALAAWALLPFLLLACGEDPPAKTADDAAPAPAEAAPDATPAAAAPVDAAPADKADKADKGDDAWAGEAEAKAEKKPEAGTGSADGKTETRTMDVIQQIIKDNRKAVRECFDKAKKDLPDLQGDMTIHFVIDPEGKVKKADLNQERSNLKAPPVVDCAIKVISAIKFPPSSRSMDTTVNYPYNFK